MYVICCVVAVGAVDVLAAAGDECVTGRDKAPPAMLPDFGRETGSGLVNDPNACKYVFVTALWPCDVEGRGLTGSAPLPEPGVV